MENKESTIDEIQNDSVENTDEILKKCDCNIGDEKEVCDCDIDETQDSDNQGAFIPQDKLEILVSEIEKMTKKLDESEKSFARLSADFANFKKRTQKEKSDIYKFANEDLIKVILPALDDYDRAISHYDESQAGPFGKGVDLVFKKLLEALKNKGLEEIDCLNQEFDPNKHHAVAIEESDEFDTETVSEVLLKGYTLNGKVIRPSMVKVVK